MWIFRSCLANQVRYCRAGRQYCRTAVLWPLMNTRPKDLEYVSSYPGATVRLLTNGQVNEWLLILVILPSGQRQLSYCGWSQGTELATVSHSTKSFSGGELIAACYWPPPTQVCWVHPPLPLLIPRAREWHWSKLSTMLTVTPGNHDSLSKTSSSVAGQSPYKWSVSKQNHQSKAASVQFETHA